MPAPPRIHYLHHNLRESSPRHLVVLDTETRWSDDAAGELHRLRLWCASDIWRVQRGAHGPGQLPAQGRTGAELAEWLDSHARSSSTTWIFAHNLGFDLATTRLPLELIALGWRVTQSALTIDHPWLRMRKHSRRITMADSHSWLPHRLETIGERIGLRKPELPDNDDSDEAWYARCAADVLILGEAMCQLLDWWDQGRYGNWSLTGPSTGWNAMRHIPMPQRVVIDPDPEARSFEHQAILGGRREAFRVGRLPRARYVELDFERSHLTVCRDLPLPQKRTVRFNSLPLSSMYLHSERWSCIAECVVRTRTPRYPLVYGRRTFHPRGEFRTVLAGPEIQAALRREELVGVGPGWAYRLGRHLAPWARWVDGLLQPERADLPAVAVMAAKAWSRTVPGKWAGRTGREVDEIDCLRPGWWLEQGVHHPSGRRCSLLYLGGRQHLIVHDQDADDSFPAVLAFIQSFVREALNELIEQFDPADLVSCNTDGVIVRVHQDPDLEELSRRCSPFQVRIKGVYRDVEVISPQHLLLDGAPRLSGVAYRADRVGPLSWSWTTWPGLARQIELGDRPGYLREHRRVDLSHVPVARWVLQNGRTEAVEAWWDPEAGNHLVAWPPRQQRPLDCRLAEDQHPVLQRLLDAVAAG